MKKLLALGLAFVMCLSLLTGCSGNNNGSNNSASNSATTGDETSTVILEMKTPTKIPMKSTLCTWWLL